MTDIKTRLEAATEGSRELDAEIGYNVVGLKKYVMQSEDGKYIDPQPWHSWVDEIAGQLVYATVPHYTTSIDAAVGLIPEGFAFALEKALYTKEGWIAKVWRFTPTNHGRTDHQDGVGATPALAICIAALKARQQDD